MIVEVGKKDKYDHLLDFIISKNQKVTFGLVFRNNKEVKILFGCPARPMFRLKFKN